MLAMRIPALGVLWLGLAAAYFAASAFGHRAAALAVLGLMAGALLASSGSKLAGLIAGVVLAAAAWHYSATLAWLVFVPPLAAFAFLACLFARTLRAGSEPLISRIARKAGPALPPDVARYTRSLTALWAACFAALFFLALGLAPVVSLEAWSRWVHALGYALPGALFLGEYAYRRRRFPRRARDPLAVLVPNVVAAIRGTARGPR